MTWIDGLGYKRWGATGLMATDAAANGVFGFLLLIVALFAGRLLKQRGNESRHVSIT
jgi:hypothetical protein